MDQRGKTSFPTRHVQALSSRVLSGADVEVGGESRWKGWRREWRLSRRELLRRLDAVEGSVRRRGAADRHEFSEVLKTQRELDAV